MPLFHVKRLFDRSGQRSLRRCTAAGRDSGERYEFSYAPAARSAISQSFPWKPAEILVTILLIVLSMDSVVTLFASFGWYPRHGKGGPDIFSVHGASVGSRETMAQTRQVAEIREPKTRCGPNCFT